MIINPLALASKGYIGNNLNITLSFKGDIDLGGSPPVIPGFGIYVGSYRGLYSNFYKFSQ